MASDVCAALDYKNTSKAVADHLDEDERMTVASAELLDMASACMQRLQQRKLSNTPTQMLSS